MKTLSASATLSRRWRRLLELLGFVTVYVGSSWLGAQLAHQTHYEAPIWPGAGLGLVAVFLLGYEWAAAVWIGALLVSRIFYNQPFVVAFAIGAVNAAAASAGAYGLKRCRFNPRLDSIRDVVLLIGIGLCGAQLVTAALGTIILVWKGSVLLADAHSSFANWWIGNVFGVILLAPLILVWTQSTREPFTKVQKFEAALLGLCFLVLYVLFYTDPFADFRAQSFLVRPHTMFPFFVWATLRFRQRGAVTVASIALAVLIGATLAGALPYKTLTASRGYDYLQSFIGVLSVTGFFLGAAVQQSLRQREDFRALFEFSGAGNAMVDSKGRFLRVNAKLCEILGYPEGELLDLTFHDVTHPDDIALSDAKHKEVISTFRSEVSFEKRYVRRDGQIIWGSVVATFLPDTDGRGSSSIAVIHDITRRKQAESELQLAKSDADAANLAKSQFLANISHEIRTPLGAILGFNEFTFDPDQSISDRLIGAHKIKQNGDLLLRIINDVLDLTKVEAGRFEVETVSIDLPDLIDDVASLLKFKAQENGTQLSFSSEGLIPESFTSDPTRLRQVLINVVGNAIKFSERGRVDVRLKHDGNCLMVFIDDNGVGMTTEQASRIFQPFHQGDSSMTRKFGGTGLGLSLSRQFARALGGDLTLTRTELGAGSGFLLTIAAPVALGTGFYRHNPERTAATSASGVVVPSAKRLQGASILVVDDAFDNRILVSRFLQREGAIVTLAESGEEAITKAMGSDYDVILIDIQMPGLDGFEATTILRERGYTRPIVALTAHAMQSDRHRSLAAGCNDHLTKPVNSQTLVESVQQFVSL